MDFFCPVLTRRPSVLGRIARSSGDWEATGDVETGPLVAPALRWGRGRTVRALFLSSGEVRNAGFSLALAGSGPERRVPLLVSRSGLALPGGMASY